MAGKNIQSAILVICIVPKHESTKTLNVNLRCTAQINIAPNTPRPAASEGVAIPRKIVPKTNTTKRVGAKTSANDLILALSGKSSSRSVRGAKSGCKYARITI